MSLPSRAEVVVIGGGAVGASAAFHLAEAGVDVLLLERDELGCGSTSKAAGGVRAQFSDPVNIALGARSLRAFEDFRQRPWAEIDLKQHGYLFLLSDDGDVAAFEDSLRLQNQLGVPSRMLTPREAGELSPVVSLDGVLAAAFCPTDGHCTPEAVVQGYAAGARRHGGQVRRQCAVTGIDVAGDAVTGVRTDSGVVATSTVVCAAGAWSSEVGAMAGVDLPVRPLRRQILVTEPVPDLPARLPFTIDFATGFYFHDEGPALLMGMPDPEELRATAARRSLARPDRRHHRVPGADAVGGRGGAPLGGAVREHAGPQRTRRRSHRGTAVPVRDRILRARLPAKSRSR